MGKIKTFQEILNQGSGVTPWFDFVLNLLICAALAFLLRQIYVRYGTSVSNRGSLSKIFLPLALTTLLVITIVKSSLALSLGLVGALSIVRFRTAIKEPEELIFLFFCIGIGIGLGANQRLITIVGTLFVCAIFWLQFLAKKEETDNLFLTVKLPGDNADETLTKIVEVLKANCHVLSFKRLDRQPESMVISFSIGFSNFDEIQKCQSLIGKEYPQAQLQILEKVYI